MVEEVFGIGRQKALKILTHGRSWPYGLDIWVKRKWN